MLKIRKQDTVLVIKGKDAGKKGRVLQILSENKKALVEGINFVKKHKRKTQQDQQGGVVSIESPISLSNLMLICKGCNRPTRVGFTVLADKTKQRFCKSCKEVI
ncbi:MAG: 50S ribosomal protein L24 [Candidatus Omnitrophica bacterium]|nr:50S ribosomal protein L24 [Candidatus Omnitrophota bacterium]